MLRTAQDRLRHPALEGGLILASDLGASMSRYLRRFTDPITYSNPYHSTVILCGKGAMLLEEVREGAASKGICDKGSLSPRHPPVRPWRGNTFRLPAVLSFAAGFFCLLPRASVRFGGDRLLDPRRSARLSAQAARAAMCPRSSRRAYSPPCRARAR